MHDVSTCRKPRVEFNEHWRRVTLPKPGLLVLGTIQSGLEIGALALVEGEGRYLKVNGSMVRVRNASRVVAAIREARQHCLGPFMAQRAPLRPIPAAAQDSAPTVMYRRRSRLAAPDPETMSR